MTAKKIFITIFSIAGGCIVELITTALSTKIVSYFKDKNIENLFIAFFFDKKFNFISVCILSLVIVGITILLVKIWQPKNKSSKREKRFLKECPKSIRVNDEIFIEYEVCFSDFTGLPTAYNLVIHCSRHNVNTVVNGARECIFANACQYNCEFRNFLPIDFEQNAKGQIQSNLINVWRNFKTK